MNCLKVYETKMVNQNNSLQVWKLVTKTEQEGNVFSADYCWLPHPNGGINKGERTVQVKFSSKAELLWSWSGHCVVLDRHDFSKYYHHQGISFIFQAVIAGTYPDNSIRMPCYDDILGVPLIHLWHKTTHNLLASASEGVYTCSRAAINAPHMDISASTWYNVSLQKQITPPDFNTKL